MHSSKPRNAGCWLALLTCLALAGCATKKPVDVARGTAADDQLPADPQALVVGAEQALQRKQYLEGAKAYARAAALSDDEALAEQATKIANDCRQPTWVLASAERWLELNATNEDAQRFAGLAALQLYQIDKAAEHLDRLLNTAYINVPAGFLALLPLLLQEGTPSGATAVLQQLVTRHPAVAEAHYALAEAALQSENFTLALRSAQRAHELLPTWTPAALVLARAQVSAGNTAEALSMAKKAVADDTKPGTQLEYAVMLMAVGKEAEGRAELQRLKDAGIGVLAAERALALTEYQSGNYTAATQRFGTLASSGAFVDESLFYLGAMAERRESWDEALQLYQRVVTGDRAVAAQARVAHIKAQRVSLDKGMEHLQQFADAHPEDAVEMVTAQATLLANEKQQQKALATLDEGLREYPDSQELKFARGFLLAKMDRVREAIAQMRDLVATRPGDPAALNALGYTLVDRTRQYREGFDLVHAAFEQTPDSGAILDSLGWAHYRLGHLDEALQTLQRARERLQDPEVELHFAQVQAALKQTAQARDTVTSALDRYPEDENLKKYADRIKEH